MKEKKKNLKYQRFVSLSAGLSFIILFLSSGVLYFIPDRKVTAWTDWSFLGLDKQQWDNLHINLGIFFLVMMVWHIYFNWKPLTNYLKIKKELKIFTREFSVALVWVSVFTVGTINMIVPLSILVNLGNGIKAINSLEEGNPPFGYAEESTFKDFCILTNIDELKAIEKLKGRGIKIESNRSSLKEIAKRNETSPKKLFALIQNKEMRLSLPSEIPIGIAHKSIERLSNEYKLDVNRFFEHLKNYDIEISIKSNFKKIAHDNHLHPAKLYAMLLASQVEKIK